ncbi:hypothetical protein GIB67_002229, partial [Kingdonia uniflora]
SEFESSLGFQSSSSVILVITLSGFGIYGLEFLRTDVPLGGGRISASHVPDSPMLMRDPSDPQIRPAYVPLGSGRSIEEAMSETMGASKSHELWNALEDSFSSKSTTRELHLSEELQSLKQMSYSISDHAKRFKKICDQLDAIGTPVSDHKKVYWFLRGLGHEYHNYVTTTLCKLPYPPFKEVVPYLLSHGLLLKILSPPNAPHESAFSAQRGGHGRRDNRGGRGGRGY